jgi:hypothetical protein
MDEVNAMLDGVHESMDQANATNGRLHATLRRIVPIGLRALEPMDRLIMFERRIHDHHGFVHSTFGRIGFIHGRDSDKRHDDLLTFSINERSAAAASYAA